MKGWRYK